MTVVGYDLARVQTLRRQTIAALEQLATLRLDDGFAFDASRTIADARRQLEHGWLAAIDRILRSDPLAAAGRSSAVQATAIRSCALDAAAVLDAFDRPYRAMSDFDLLADLWDLQRRHGDVDGLADAFWTETFPDYAEEIAHRLATSSDFFDALVAHDQVMPIVGLVLSHHELRDDHTTAIARHLLAAHQGTIAAHGPINDAAVEAALVSLASRPHLALEVLGTVDAFRDVMRHEWTDRDLAGAAIAAAFAAVDETETTEERMTTLLRSAAATTAAHDRTRLPAPIAIALAQGIAGLAPMLGRNSEESATWLAITGTPSERTRLTAAEMDDLVGALLRDPTAGAALFASGFALTAEATHQWIDRDPDERTIERGDADGFAAILERAATNERLEDEAARAADVALIGYVFEGIEAIGDQATAGAAPLVGAATEWIVDATEALVAGSITLTELPTAAFIGRFDEVRRIEVVRNLVERDDAARNHHDADVVDELRRAIATFDDAVRRAETEEIDLAEVVVTLEGGYRDLDPSPRLHRAEVYDLVVANDD